MSKLRDWLDRVARTPVGAVVPILLTASLAVVGVSVTVLVIKAPPPRQGEEFAAWVQAVGTIGAIIATAGIAWWVPWAAARERQVGLRRTAAYYLMSCAEAVESLRETLDESHSRPNTMFGRQPINKVGYDLSHYKGMLSSFPMHELPHGDVPSAFLRMQNCLTRAAKVIDSYNQAVSRTSPIPAGDYNGAMTKVAVRARKIADEFWKPAI